MTAHLFIFRPGIWQGRGKITFTMAEDELNFSTRWTVSPAENQTIAFSQLVELDGMVESLNDPTNKPQFNKFVIRDVTPDEFTIALIGPTGDEIVGKGLLTEKKIAWEFRKPDEGLEGFEIYELQDDGSYKMRAEFLGGETYRTLIQGEIRPQ